MKEHEEILDLLKIPYSFEEVDKSYFARKVKQYLASAYTRKSGMDLLTQKAKMFKHLLLLSFWLDDTLTELDKELSELDVEIFFPKEGDMVVSRDLGNGEKATFVEKFTHLESHRARQLLLGKKLKGRNNIQD